MAVAERDGIYVLNGIGYRIRKGHRLPPGASMRAEKGETPESGQVSSETEPKWFLELKAKAEASGDVIPGRQPKETEAAYKERVTATGATETTNGNPQIETTAGTGSGETPESGQAGETS